MSIQAVDLRRGAAVKYNGDVWICVENEKVAKGNKRSYQSVALRNAKTGQLIRERFRVNEAFEEVFVSRKPMTYLYSDASGHVVMDNETYEQMHLPAELIGDRRAYLKENIALEVAFADDKPVGADLPNTVELKVVSTPPEVRGATATQQLKDAVCEGGARIKVPAFIAVGTVVKVDTRTGEYLGRA
ncbi:MAG TPA: elongation factor P [Phycisphaerae bacterium]|nr:elongation factor P [Phycisphaerae bacterium]